MRKMKLIIPEPGQLVQVRQRHYVVTDIKKSILPPTQISESADGVQHLIFLSSVEDDALGEDLQIIWEIEPGAQVFEKMALPEPSGFDQPHHLDAYLNAVRWGVISSFDEKILQSPFRSGIEIEEYQLEPVARALQMPRVNLLIADDVGLGKTIEAGLVVQELILRHRVRSVLVICPSSIQIQWQEQMRDKFGLEFRIINSEMMKTLRRRRGIHVNPWTHFPRLITSIDFLKRERPLRLLREALPAEGESTYPRRFDLLIVDEAHNVSPSGSGYYATDSLRTLAIRTLVSHFEHKLFLTATPHNGYPESFTALLELLDSQRFARGVRPNRSQLQTVMVRRLKTELKRKWDGSQRFAERQVDALEVDYSTAERQAHQNLQEYTRLRQKRIQNEAERFATEFVLKLLKKRLFSSPAAFLTTLEKHLQTLRVQNKTEGKARPSLGILRRQIETVSEDYADDDLYEDTTQETVALATRTLAQPESDETSLLQDLLKFAQQVATRPDSKAEKLLIWLRENIKPDGEWSNERVLIFTEYRATQKWLHNLLAAEGFAQNQRLMTLYGGMPDEERERIKAAFQAAPDISPVRILLATDAASEGIDLQNHCSKLIHYEIPWNPNRMEQRNGRLDRHGQRAAAVQVFHFVGKGFKRESTYRNESELEGDLEFLMRAVLKTEAIRDDLGKVGPVIAQQVEEAMLGRRHQLNTVRAEEEAAPVRKMLTFERKIREQLEKLNQQLESTKRDLNISARNLQRVVEIGLALAGQPPLRATEVPGIWPDPRGIRGNCPVFHLPPLSGSWAPCSEGLAHPHTRQIRPIVFEPLLAQGRDDVVLVHLNHRLVQMCTRLLRAEIWSQGEQQKLHRVTARIISGKSLNTPAVVAFGRLVVLGGDNHRLHEELIAASGAIEEGRFSRLNVGQTKQLLDDLLDDPPPVEIQEKLAALWPVLAQPLSNALHARMRERTQNLGKNLNERAEKQAQDLTAILNELAQTIRAELDNPEITQFELFSSEERMQLEQNLTSLQLRLHQIPEEINRETAAIRQRFQKPTPRLFPVAVMFLVPARIATQAQGGY